MKNQTRIFKSLKDKWMIWFLYGFCLLCLGLGIFMTYTADDYITLGVCLPTAALLFWLAEHTQYIIRGEELICISGPFKKKIALKSIRKINVNERKYVGNKPALSNKGMVVYYNKFDDIYISPEKPDELIETILEYNNKVEVLNAE